MLVITGWWTQRVLALHKRIPGWLIRGLEPQVLILSPSSTFLVSLYFELEALGFSHLLVSQGEKKGKFYLTALQKPAHLSQIETEFSLKADSEEGGKAEIWLPHLPPHLWYSWNSCKVTKLFQLLIPVTQRFFQGHLLPVSPTRIHGITALGWTLETLSFLPYLLSTSMCQAMC